MFAKTFLVATVLAALTSAQTIATSSAASRAGTTTVSQSMPPSATQGFIPAAVNSTLRLQWCSAQLHTCPQICGGAAAVNSCQDQTLTYSCVCPNGTVPDCSAFAQTLPFYICQQTYIQCVANNPNNLEAQNTCTTNEQCGSRNATAEAIAQTSAVHSSTASRTSSSSGSATASATSASATSNAAAYQQVGTGLFVAGLMAAAKLFL